MKFKTNFKDMREAVVTIGKAVKKNMSPIEISLVKIEALCRAVNKRFNRRLRQNSGCRRRGWLFRDIFFRHQYPERQKM